MLDLITYCTALSFDAELQSYNLQSSCLVVNFEDMETKQTKAPNLVQLFFSMYIVILEEELSPNTTLTGK